jgi:hypothetical protein
MPSASSSEETTLASMFHSQDATPDENGQLPCSWYPPLTFVARPAGKMNEEAISALGSRLQTRSAARAPAPWRSLPHRHAHRVRALRTRPRSALDQAPFRIPRFPHLCGGNIAKSSQSLWTRLPEGSDIANTYIVKQRPEAAVPAHEVDRSDLNRTLARSKDSPLAELSDPMLVVTKCVPQDV